MNEGVNEYTNGLDWLESSSTEFLIRTGSITLRIMDIVFMSTLVNVLERKLEK